MIEFELIKLSTRVSVGGNLTKAQVPFIAERLIQDYLGESLADFKLCFERGAMGYYGEMQRLDGVTIGGWFKKYLDEKYEVAERELVKAKESHYTPPSELPSELIDNWLKSLKASNKKEIRPITDEDIKREGKQDYKRKATGYVPNPELIILNQKKREWMRKYFDPITSEPKTPDYPTFEEYIKTA